MNVKQGVIAMSIQEHRDEQGLAAQALRRIQALYTIKSEARGRRSQIRDGPDTLRRSLWHCSGRRAGLV